MIDLVGMAKRGEAREALIPPPHTHTGLTLETTAPKNSDPLSLDSISDTLSTVDLSVGTKQAKQMVSV